MRKRRKEKSEEIIGLSPPTEAWLLRKLAEIRREERYQDQPVARPESKRAKKRVS
jgi:hypothetical protein